MKIMLDTQFRPHDTCDSDAWKKLQRQGWKLTRAWTNVGDDPYAAKLTNGDVTHDIVVGWTNTICPLRWADVPDGIV